MALALNEEQRMLKDSAKQFFASKAPVEALRKLRDGKDATGYATSLWQDMVELGWSAITIPENYGGLQFGYLGLGQIFEEAGHTLAASPLFATAVLGASAIELGGSEVQKNSWLPRIAAGEVTLALALEEQNRHAPTHIATRAEKADRGFRLTGSKVFVLDGHTADYLIVAARSSGNTGDANGISLFLVDANAKGVTRTRTLMMDSRNAARIDLSNVEVAADALIGDLDHGFAILDQVLDRGRIVLAAEMLGGCLEMFNRTVAYLKEREQFGVKIGSFQALKHRASIMFTEIELCKSVVLEALTAADEKPQQLAKLASLAKTKLNDTYQLVTNEATQMHGGIGVTDELDVGLFLKRCRVAMQIFGDSAFHRDRYATLHNY
jgi:alkylation response protein AidB-like acyl-CoA dehydrogenase